MNLEQRARAHAALGEPVRLAIVDELVLGDAAPGELSARFGLATNLLAFHLRVLDDAGLVRRVRSEGDRRRQYVQLRLDDPAVAALTRPAHGPASAAIGGEGVPEQVVFVCTANSARSQLAAAAWRRVSALPVASAGTHPAARVHPRAVAAARRHGLDLTGATPTALPGLPGPGLPGSLGVLGAADGDPGGEPRSDGGPLVVAVCDNAHEELARGLHVQDLPGPTDHQGPGGRGGPARRWLHWHVPDPVRVDTDEAFEAAYAQITERVDRLAAALDPTRNSDLPVAS